MKRHTAMTHSRWTATQPLTLTKPMSFASSRKLCLLMFSPYLRIRPQWLPDTRLQRHADGKLRDATVLCCAQGAASPKHKPSLVPPLRAPRTLLLLRSTQGTEQQESGRNMHAALLIAPSPHSAGGICQNCLHISSCSKSVSRA